MELIQHLETFMERHEVQRDDGIVVGCSGGVDSMVLADVLHRQGYRIGVYHMNAGLRAEEADADESLVEEWAAAMGVPFEAGHYTVKKGKGKSTQMQAREKRYADYEKQCRKWNMKWIATAHHRQDRLETTILNLLRGSGIQGLTALRDRRNNILRPWLECNKEDLYAWAREKNVPWREDRSNLDPKYARNQIRLEVIPAMQKVGDRGLEGAYKTIDLLQDATDYLAEKLSEAVEDMVWWDGVQLRIEKDRLIGNPHAGLLLHYILTPYGSFDKAAILQGLAGQPGRRFTAGDYELLIDREHLIVFERQEVDKREVKLQRGARKIVKPIGLQTDIIQRSELEEIPFDRDMLCIDADKLEFPLTLRLWKKGDRFQPFGMNGMKKISDYLTDEKLPLHEKERVHVLCSGSDIVWVVGYRPDERYRIDDDTKLVYFAALNESTT